MLSEFPFATIAGAYPWKETMETFRGLVFVPNFPEAPEVVPDVELEALLPSPLSSPSLGSTVPQPRP